MFLLCKKVIKLYFFIQKILIVTFSFEIYKMKKRQGDATGSQKT